MGSLILNVSGWVCESQDNDSLFDDTDFSRCRKHNLMSENLHESRGNSLP